MEIAFIRHGQTPGNAQGRYIGVTDEPLSEAGRGQCERLRPPAVQRVYVSPMLRCRETAAILYPSHEPVVLDDMREYDFGDFENKCYNELCIRADYRAWIDSHGHGNPPDGEDWRAFRCRCCRAFLRAVDGCMGQGVTSAAFVVHGGTIMAILERFGEPPRAFHDWQVHNVSGWLATAEPVKWRVQKRLHILRGIGGDVNKGAG